MKYTVVETFLYGKSEMYTESWPFYLCAQKLISKENLNIFKWTVTSSWKEIESFYIGSEKNHTWKEYVHWIWEDSVSRIQIAHFSDSEGLYSLKADQILVKKNFIQKLNST